MSGARLTLIAISTLCGPMDTVASRPSQVCIFAMRMATYLSFRELCEAISQDPGRYVSNRQGEAGEATAEPRL